MKTLLAAALVICITSPAYATDADTDYRYDIKACFHERRITIGQKTWDRYGNFELTYPNAQKVYDQCVEDSKQLYEERKKEEQTKKEERLRTIQTCAIAQFCMDSDGNWR